VNVIGLGKVSLPVKLSVGADKVRSVRVLVTISAQDVKAGEQPITFALSDAAHSETRTVNTIFAARGSK
jgi:hypothetical protein